ncbi:unnamed protein product [Ranitomeya imitator]|uniref:Uncharacterized protein n=1 Tax=Ranitomeya imitator TaxID=111125 RepID=A0ABN9L5Y4_9NEOB|nr:unnamed protein product [Ranitomeya imitator]
MYFSKTAKQICTRKSVKADRHGSGADSDYDNTQSTDTSSGVEGRRYLELSRDEDFHADSEDVELELDGTLPSTEDVILRTEQVTKNIQELLRAAQEFKHDSSKLEEQKEEKMFQLLFLYPALRKSTPQSQRWHRSFPRSFVL